MPDAAPTAIAIDLHLDDTPRAAGAYLVATADGPGIVDCGPTSTLPQLEAGLAELGISLDRDVRHLLLTHIHLDHAGGAGELARRNPGLTVLVSEVGAPHVVAPERLERSARRLYLDDFDRLWGALTPVPEDRIAIAAPGDVVGLDCFLAPGHAKHHVAYLHADGTIYSGDSAGVRIQPHSTVLPVSPPPDIDVAAWHETIAAMRERAPQRIAPTHFGIAEDAASHLDQLEARLDEWASRVRAGEEQDAFTDSIAELIERRDGAEALPPYAAGGPMFLSWLGLDRWARQQREAEGAAG
jgi:glyoxylase-like metal-dependent hydrolase (beta-lactamase superfamily II)